MRVVVALAHGRVSQMSDKSKYTPIDVLIFPLLKNEGKFQEFGLKILLGRPFRCKNVQQVSTLPFIVEKFHERQNEVYFQWREDLSLHTVHMDPNPDKDTIIIALAKFNKKDRRAVDLPAPA